MNMYFFLLVYPIIGGGIKLIDNIYDEKIFSKKIAIAIAPLIGVLWAYTMLIDEASTTILVAVIIGVLLKGKIDNLAHLIGIVSIISFSVMAILYLDGMEVMMLPLIFLTSAALLDEVGNDVIGYVHKYQDDSRFRYKFTLYFFGRRYLMKAALLYLVLLGVFPLYFLLAFILFDEAYIIVDLYTPSRKKISSS